MSVLDRFSLPYLGMKDGLHQIEFTVDNLFFAQFESSPIKDGNFTVTLEIDKRPNLSVLHFDIQGDVAAICDRCLADVRLPVFGENTILVKVAHTEDSFDHDEVIFIKDGQSVLNVAQLVYEFICVSLPVVNIFDCDNQIPKMCDEDVLKKISSGSWS